RVGIYLKDTNFETETWNHVFSPKFRYLVACEELPAMEHEDVFHLVDLQDHKILTVKGLPNGRSVFSPQENYVTLFGANNVQFLVKSSTGKVVKTYHKSIIHGFVPDESLFVYETRIGNENDGVVDLHIWDIQTQQEIKWLKNAKYPVLSPDGKTVAAIMPD